MQLLSQALAFVPTADPRSLTLPVDPLETLLKSIPLTPLEIEDKWATDVEVVKHIRDMLSVQKGKPKTETCWNEEGPYLVMLYWIVSD